MKNTVSIKAKGKLSFLPMMFAAFAVNAHNSTFGQSGSSPALAFLRIFSAWVDIALIVALLPTPRILEES